MVLFAFTIVTFHGSGFVEVSASGWRTVGRTVGGPVGIGRVVRIVGVGLFVGGAVLLVTEGLACGLVAVVVGGLVLGSVVGIHFTNFDVAVVPLAIVEVGFVGLVPRTVYLFVAH